MIVVFKILPILLALSLTVSQTTDGACNANWKLANLTQSTKSITQSPEHSKSPMPLTK